MSEKKCKVCKYWDKKKRWSDEMRSCAGFDGVKRDMFSNDGCGNDNIYHTHPNFFCGLFETMKT